MKISLIVNISFILFLVGYVGYRNYTEEASADLYRAAYQIYISKSSPPQVKFYIESCMDDGKLTRKEFIQLESAWIKYYKELLLIKKENVKNH